MKVPAWRRGQSGNPGGRPREVGHVRELARRHTPEAIETLAAIMRSGKSDASRVAAAEALLDRGWGRPAVSLSGADGGGPIEVEHRVPFYLPDNGQDRGDAVDAEVVAVAPVPGLDWPAESVPVNAVLALPDNGRME